MNERICAYCGKPIHDAKGRRKYHVECAKIVEKKQNKEWQFNHKLSHPNPCQRATPETVAVALGYKLEHITPEELLMCAVIARAMVDYGELYNGKCPNGKNVFRKKAAEIEEFFASFGMPTICKKIKQLSK